MQLKINRGAVHGVAHYDRDAVDDIQDLGLSCPALGTHLFTVVVVSISSRGTTHRRGETPGGREG